MTPGGISNGDGGSAFIEKDFGYIDPYDGD
jgi:hypothetical protein